MSVLCVHVTDLNSFMDTSQVKKIVSTKTMLMLIVCNFLFLFLVTVVTCIHCVTGCNV